MEHLFRIINMLRRPGRAASSIFRHKMEEILRISDEVTIMRDGTWVATAPGQASWTMDEIIRLMVGRELTNQLPAQNEQARRSAS